MNNQSILISAVARNKKTTKSEKKQNLKTHIPAVLYGKGLDSIFLNLDRAQFIQFKDNLDKGRLANTPFTVEYDGKKVQVLIKDIQYKRICYSIIHLDLTPVNEETVVKVLVPIQYTGHDNCQALKLGGNLRSVMRQIRIKCAKRNIPDTVTFDLTNTNIGDSLRLKDLSVPEGVEFLSESSSVFAVMNK